VRSPPRAKVSAVRPSSLRDDVALRDDAVAAEEEERDDRQRGAADERARVDVEREAKREKSAANSCASGKPSDDSSSGVMAARGVLPGN